MKLNLLPTYVSKGAQAKTARLIAILVSVASVLAAVAMIFLSQQALANAKKRAEELKPQADEAVRIAKEADTIAASGAGVTRNIELARAMGNHNYKYTRFYKQILPYIPSFFRPITLSVEPVSETSARLTMTGVLRSSQQYADLPLALLRIPGATTVSRSGYVNYGAEVPPVTETDPKAEPYRADQGPLPTDPVERIDALIARAEGLTSGFTGAGNFGTDGNLTREQMPDWSQVTVSVLLNSTAAAAPGGAPAVGGVPAGVPAGAPAGGAPAAGVKPGTIGGINLDLRAPDPRSTLSSAATAAPAAGPAAGPSFGPGGPQFGPGRAGPPGGDPRISD